MLDAINFEDNIVYNKNTTMRDAEIMARNGIDGGLSGARSLMPKTDFVEDWLQYGNFLEILLLKKSKE